MKNILLAMAALSGLSMDPTQSLRSLNISRDTTSDSARNGGHKPGRSNRAYKRAAAKKRNQAKHRAARRRIKK